MTPNGPRNTATIYAVAERAGVSIATVSRVQSNPGIVTAATRERVQNAIADLDYVPTGSARSLAAKANEAHGIVLPELAGPYYAELLMGYEATAAEAGQSVLLTHADSRTDIGRTVRQLAAKVDGLVAFGTAVPRDALATVARTLPVVVIAGDPGPGIDAVITENRSSSAALVHHLREHGRWRLLFVGDPHAAPDVRERYDGFVDAHRDSANATCVAEPPVVVPFTESAGSQVADRWVNGSLSADALVCANDELALAVLLRLRLRGVNVPDDVAVTGFDDLMAARYTVPALTTVRQPVRELGAAAAARLHRLIRGTASNQNPAVLPTDLIIRQSCGCPDSDAVPVNKRSSS